MNRVLFMFTLATLAGILCPSGILLGILCFVAVSLFLYKKKFGMFTIVTGFVLGILLINFVTPQSQLTSFCGKDIPCSVEVKSVPVKTNYGISFEGVIRTVDGKKANEKTIMYVSGEPNIKENTIVTFNAVKFKLPNEQLNFNSFDYQRYLKSQKIFVISNAKAEDVKETENSKITIQSLALKVNSFLCDTIEQKFDFETAALLKGILLGDKSDMSPKVKADFRDSGLSHVLAVSGLHLTIITAILSIFLRRLSKHHRGLILLFFIWSFAFIVGLPISIIRAAFMLSMLTVANCLHYENDGLTAMSLIALLLVIHNPYVVYDTSFSLSFSALLGIFCISPFFQRENFLRIPTMLKDTLVMSFSAQIGTMPILFLNFGRINFLGMVSNLLIVVLLPAIYFVVLLAFVSRLGFIFTIASWLLKALMWWASVCAEIPFGNFAAPFEPLFIISIFGITVLCLLLNNFKNVKTPSIIFGCLLVLSFVGYRIGIAPPKDTQITFISVGQADCAMLRTTTGETYLMDVATANSAEDEIVPYLRRAGVTKLDGIFISHFDDDHCGGLETVAENFDIKVLFIPDTADVGWGQYKALVLAQKKDISVVPMHTGDSVQTDSVTFTALYPNKGKTDNHNASSLVIRADNNDFSAIFPGDLEKDNVLNDCDVDILKVSHHGSSNGSTAEFLAKCTPSVAVISLSKNNSYGFPKQEVVDKITQYTNYIYRTDLNGTVEINCDQKNYSVRTLR